MKLLHLSDLHLGKRLNEYSLIADQRYILQEIVNIADAEKPAAVLICGDIYDKSIPSAEAVELFDEFLVALTLRGIKVLAIYGNHDSAERIAFGGRLLDRSGVYLSPVYDGTVRPVTLTDEYGAVDCYLLPFIKPAHVRRAFPEEGIESYTDAVAVAVANFTPGEAKRRVLLTHQFVTGAQRCESEEVSVGGSDQVDVSVFEGFSYVALGHIHGPQKIGKETVRYCGTPLKYSFSEVKHEKSVTVVELGEETVGIRTVPLKPERELGELRGAYEELSALSFYEKHPLRYAYLHITLTDEEDVPDAMAKLRIIYPYLMKLGYDNRRTRGQTEIEGAQAAEEKTPLELFAELYEKQNNAPLTRAQQTFAAGLIEKIWEVNG